MSYLPTGSGVAYSSDQEKFSSIEGNVGNAVRLRDHVLADAIIGFIRLPDQVSRASGSDDSNGLRRPGWSAQIPAAAYDQWPAPLNWAPAVEIAPD